MSLNAALVFSALFVQCITGQCIGAHDGWAGPCASAPLAGPIAAGPIAAGPLAAGSIAAGPLAAGPLAAGSIAAGPLAVDWAGITAANGGGFAVSSASPIAPVGVSVLSDNAIEGALAVGGALPYLGAVALEAALPTAGAGAVAYGCGNGAVAITTEDVGAIGFAGVAGPTGFVPGITGPIAPGLGLGLPGCGPTL